MAPNPRLIDERLQALYDKLPSIKCRGLCHDSCGPIDLSVRERARMERAAGHRLGTNGLTCNMLDPETRRCGVYEQRPFICRMWGVVESMPCIYGCQAEPGLLPDAEAATLLAESLSVGGGITHADAELFRLLSEARAEDPDGFKTAIRHLFKSFGVRPTLDGRTPDQTGLESVKRPGG